MDPVFLQEAHQQIPMTVTKSMRGAAKASIGVPLPHSKSCKCTEAHSAMPPHMGQQLSSCPWECFSLPRHSRHTRGATVPAHKPALSCWPLWESCDSLLWKSMSQSMEEPSSQRNECLKTIMPGKAIYLSEPWLGYYQPRQTARGHRC